MNLKSRRNPAGGISARRQAVLYARVSSKEQEKEGFSIPSQIKLLHGYAEANNLDVARVFIDVETAKRTGRTGFGEMMAFLKRSPTCRILLVEKTDRLYRNLKDYVILDEIDLEIHLNSFLQPGKCITRRCGRPRPRPGTGSDSRARRT